MRKIKLKKLSERELDELYQSYLDECFPNLKIAGLDYLTSRALREVDQLAYRVGYADWLDGELSDGVIVEADGVYFTPN